MVKLLNFFDMNEILKQKYITHIKQTKNTQIRSYPFSIDSFHGTE